MGRSATAVLVAQDIVAIFILVFAAALGASATPEILGADLLVTLAKAVIALVIALLAGRFVVRPLFKSLAATDNQEAFTVVALFIVLAASAATQRVGLSLTLGAFLAGMAISDTPYRHVVQTEVRPFQGLLLGLFFMSVGMGVDIPAVAAIWPAVLATALVIVIVKTVIVFAAARLNGWALPGATQLGFLLSQGSEFTLVVVGVSTIAGAMPPGWAGVLTAAVAVTLVAAPIWTALGLHIARLLAERSKAAPIDAAEVAEDNPVLVFGMGPEGRLAAEALRDNDIPYVAIESDPERFVSAASDGYEVVYGDARDRRLMESLGAARARAIVLDGANHVGHQLPHVVIGAQPRFIAVSDGADRVRQASLGLRAHLALAEPRGIELATDLLTELGIGQTAIAQWIADQADRRGLRDKAERETEAA
jgi:CPA2 family monovalent cation:H+ antiporter-2